jgi:4a-hydroxytetrahydrobiopterin dehydratase
MTEVDRGGSMSGSIAPARFHELDWKVLAYETCTHFRTGSLAEGVALTRAVERLVESSSRQPDLDLRTNGVTVRLKGTKKGELGEDDLALAADISAAARALEIPVDLTGLQSFQIAIDALDIPGVMHFWEAVLGYVQIGDILVDPHFEGPVFWFQQMDAPRPQRNRIHVDLYLPEDQARARVEAGLTAGGRVVDDANVPEWWTLADPEGNEVDVAPWPDAVQD